MGCELDEVSFSRSLTSIEQTYLTQGAIEIVGDRFDTFGHLHINTRNFPLTRRQRAQPRTALISRVTSY